MLPNRAKCPILRISAGAIVRTGDTEDPQMDEELRNYLDGMMVRINDQFEHVLDRLGSLERDFVNTKEFLVGDALISGRRWFDSENRITKLEEEMRRMRDR
jgi:hypothetical protein